MTLSQRPLGSAKLSLLLAVYGAIVIAGKLLAAPPSLAGQPQIADHMPAPAPSSCGVARQAASCNPALVAAPLGDFGQGRWRNAQIRRTRRTATSSSS